MDNGEPIYIKRYNERYPDIVEFIKWDYENPNCNLLKGPGIVYDMTPVSPVDEIRLMVFIRLRITGCKSLRWC